MKKKVCIFCGANTGNSPEVVNETKLLCDLLINAGFDLVYGGATTGLMGIAAERFLNKGMDVIGVRPKKLIVDENVHENLTEIFVVDSMQERKAKMIELSDVFIALPGGVGTLDEIIETYTLNKIGFIDKPSGVLNTLGYYDGLKMLLNKMTETDFLKTSDKSKLSIGTNPRDLMEKMQINKNINGKEIDKIAFIAIRDGKILVSKSFGKNKYYIPGGKREEGESDIQTLIREVNEELSVDVIPETVEYIETFTAQADGEEQGIDVRMTYYTSEYKNVLKASNEIEEIQWLNYADINLVTEVDKKIFNYLKNKGKLN